MFLECIKFSSGSEIMGNQAVSWSSYTCQNSVPAYALWSKQVPCIVLEGTVREKWKGKVPALLCPDDKGITSNTIPNLLLRFWQQRKTPLFKHQRRGKSPEAMHPQRVPRGPAAPGAPPGPCCVHQPRSELARQHNHANTSSFLLLVLV